MYRPPDNWGPLQPGENCALKDVPVGSKEWVTIETRMKETLPTVIVRKIERVQNLWQWEKVLQFLCRFDFTSFSLSFLVLFYEG